ATPSSVHATTAAVGRPSATSRANVGPDNAATGASGQVSVSSSVMRTWRCGSSPFVAETIGRRRGNAGAAPFTTLPKNSDGTATTTTSAPSSACSTWPVAMTRGGSATPGRNQGFSRVRPINSRSSGSRTHSRTSRPVRPRWVASAVPQLPAPTTARLMHSRKGGGAPRRGSSCRGALPQPAFRSAQETGDVVPVARDDDGRDHDRRCDERARVPPEERADRHRDGRQNGAERHVPGGGDDQEPHQRRGDHDERHEPEERAQRRRHTLAAAEPEIHRPAVADDRKRPAGCHGCPIAAEERPSEGDHAVALRDVAEKRERPRQRAEGPEHVRLADVTAALAADVRTAEGSRDETA